MDSKATLNDEIKWSEDKEMTLINIIEDDSVINTNIISINNNYAKDKEHSVNDVEMINNTESNKEEIMEIINDTDNKYD